MIKLQNQEKEERKKMIKKLYNKDNILLISECGGRWDLMINILSDSPDNFEKEFSKFLDEYSEQILNYDLFLPLKGTNFGRKYIYNSKEQRKRVTFGKEKIIKISDSELKILKALSKNARKNASISKYLLCITAVPS